MNIKCRIQTYSRLKKHLKLVLIVENEDCKNLGSLLDAHMDKPLLLNVVTDTKTLQQERLQISPEQRSKIFALVGDIANYTGESKENQRHLLLEMYCAEVELEKFSLSDCLADRAANYINWLINFCFEEGIPLSESPAEGLADVESYIHVCIAQKRCCVCCAEAIPMRWGDMVIPLCDKHKAEFQKNGKEAFEQRYHVCCVKKV